ncbi:hypothetical protein [Soonwooa purpurea]
MWIIVILVIAGVIIWVFASSNNDNEKIRDYNNQTGGLKNRHQKFVNILEKKYDMSLKYDDGRKIYYEKKYPNGDLNIGLKLEFDNSHVIFSEFTKNSGTLIKGKNVTYYNYDDKIIEKSINTSILDLPLSLTETHNKKYRDEWKKFMEKSRNENFINEYITNLYIKDDINPEKFIGNFTYKKMGFSNEIEETESMRDIFLPSLAFTDYFVVAYPDVYLWAQKNTNRVNAYKILENIDEDYFDYIENLIPFYRKIIDQYKEEGNQLECS